MPENVGVRLQSLGVAEQAVALARLAAGRAQSGEFTPNELDDLFRGIGLPAPSKISNAIASLDRRKWLRRGSKLGTWKLTPLGRATADSLFSDMDLAVLSAEVASEHGAVVGGAVHGVIPPTLAPPLLIPALRRFLDDHPFETNVFAMSRYPDAGDTSDPVAASIEAARRVCHAHGLQLHLASDRAMDDDLWTNVAAHIWASRYGIGFFEDRVGHGVNYNLTIEVGSMLVTGRRCALLKDRTVERLPTDFVGRIYKDIDLDDVSTTARELHIWIRDDLALGRCPLCP